MAIPFSAPSFEVTSSTGSTEVARVITTAKGHGTNVVHMGSLRFTVMATSHTMAG